MPTPYYLIETADLEGNPGVRGGMGKRWMPEQKISNYIGVPSVDDYMVKVKTLGGKIIMPKTGVPGWGYLAICVDTENNTFGLWEEDSCNRLRIGSKEGLDGCKGIKPSQSPTCLTYNT